MIFQWLCVLFLTNLQKKFLIFICFLRKVFYKCNNHFFSSSISTSETLLSNFPLPLILSCCTFPRIHALPFYTYSVLKDFRTLLWKTLLSGCLVNIAGLGYFYLTVQGKGTEKVEDFTVADISGLRVCFRTNNHHLDGELFDEPIGYPAIGQCDFMHRPCHRHIKHTFIYGGMIILIISLWNDHFIKFQPFCHVCGSDNNAFCISWT